MRRTVLLALLMLVVLVATAAVYSRVLDGPPIFDDGYVFDDPVRHVTSLSPQEIGPAITRTRAEPRRCLTSLTFTLDFYFFGEDTTSFHTVNVFLHLLTVIACFGFVREILRLAGRDEPPAIRVAFLAASLFALNPIQTQAVSYIWQRSTVLAAGLSLASLWLFAAGLRAGRWRIVVAVLLVPLAVLAKQNAIMVLPAMLGIVLLFRPPKTSTGITSLLVIGTGALVLAFYAATALWWGGESATDVISRGYDGRGFTMGQRLLTQPRVVLSLLSLILVPLPFRLNLDHDVSVSTDLFVPFSTFPSHLALLLAGLVAIIMAGRRPLLTFGILWYFVMLIPECTVVPLELMFEHRAYLPSVGVFLLIALGLDALFRSRPALAVGLTVVLLLLYGGLTWRRNVVWTSREMMWEDVVAKSPEKARGHFNLGLAIRDRYRAGDATAFLPARQSIGRALELDSQPRYAMALSLLHRSRDPSGEVLPLFEDLERMRLAGQFSTAEELLRELTGRYPEDARLHYELARMLASSGGIPEALDALERAIERGFDDRERLKWDSAIGTLRSKRRFEELMEMLD